MPQINHALRNFYRNHPESVEISLESIGVSPQKTQPTVLVVCTSVGKVRAILKKKVGDLFNETTGFALKVCRGQVLRSRKDSENPRRSAADLGLSSEAQSGDGGGDGDGAVPANPDFQEKPNNGASIGAWIGDRHLPPVSFGGLVIVDDKPYGMTVHHMLDDPDAPSAPSFAGTAGETQKELPPDTRRSQAWYDDGESSGTDFAAEFSESDTYSETDATSDDDEQYSDDEGEDEDGEYEEPGDIPGVEPGCGEGYVVTQPALDDVPPGFYPSADTADEDHLDTYSLGEVYASSGIRRRRENGLVHEIDWALFEFKSERLPDNNSVPGIESGPPGEGAVRLTKVAPASALAGLEVQCVARTSGVQTGLIMPALTSVKIYGRVSPSHTYQVSSAVTAMPEGANEKKRPAAPLGIPGDSGAWVIDKYNGRVCGHVLAWSQRKQVAYICPMDVLLLDIAETLDATEIRLPGGDAVVFVAQEEVPEGRTLPAKYEDIVEVSDDTSSDGGEALMPAEGDEKAEEAHIDLAGSLERLSVRTKEKFEAS